MEVLRVRDQAPGEAAFELEIELGAVDVSAAELIRGRVFAELAAGAGAVARPLVDRSAEEAALNGPRPGSEPSVEEEAQRALRAFERGRFMLLVDGRQVARLDDRIALCGGTRVTFLRLVPLRGG